MVATFIVAIAHVPLVYLFMHGLDMGILGIAVATSVKDFLLLISIMLYGYCSKQVNQTL